MVTVEFFLEGFYITILGVVVVFLVLALLALAMYGIGHLEKALIERKKPVEVKPLPKEEKEEKVIAEEKPSIEPKKLAVITAAVLAYIAEKNAQLRPLPFKKKPSDVWRLYGVQTQLEEVENFNYEMGAW
ncbi:MAG: glutaconyl-CoA/methylmalonyl-CoA decarboxylase subunit delta [Thermococcaceae archaeon]|jgi:sodium pump decarboxylase gamma subunit|uniref:OadG family protein n=1 Tax=Thermococcus TaxID=2263 RepID=UPI0005B2A90F|nr:MULTISPECIES: OadG family protein [Thermococcus]KUJ99741.1 MAG: Methylmalonyl-CoA decarboxylase, delta subunit [Thermococcales archaeon 44_46]MDK2783617.1 glutaconyl-CoA/methylmalonyl-CoA decarboxylase subunit delta [Thermococcaceae archaeon]MCA6214192.1 OadG family protein [Thermococcus bergensis]MDK2853273.1 glutaconyl-CoA/methylmalonyl-CoA decarboxylase subunit delta [Thermococcaceae archaeon]MDK2982612.1 glutaconyl-CoA/methylmalonyl-CoA decarboxylase subunit delta [Thermococcaceae archa